MGNIRIDIFNKSTVLSDIQIASAIPDLQMQIVRDFEPHWIIGAELNFIKTGQTIPAGGWQMGIFDLSDQADALGYHELTQDGLPLGKIFAKSDEVSKSSWTVTLSHELLEMLADPGTSTCENAQTSNSNRFYAREVCDPVEADSLGYKINNTLVSNFVFPEWFQVQWPANSRQFDFMKSTTNPLQLTSGGYISFVDLANPSIGWQQSFADREPNLETSRSSDRHLKRRLPKNLWRKSNPNQNQ